MGHNNLYCVIHTCSILLFNFLILPSYKNSQGIRKRKVDGLIFVYSKQSTSNCPLSVGDVIISLNGITLRNVEGDVDDVTKLFLAFADSPRNLVIRRAVHNSPVPLESSSKIGGGDNIRTTSAAATDNVITTNATTTSNQPAVLTGGTSSPYSYREGIISAITQLKDRSPGSSSIAIKKCMQSNFPLDKKWQNHIYLSTLKKLVLSNSDIIQTKGAYKLSVQLKAKVKVNASKKNKNAPSKKMNSSTVATTYISKQFAPEQARVARVSLSPVAQPNQQVNGAPLPPVSKPPIVGPLEAAIAQRLKNEKAPPPAAPVKTDSAAASSTCVQHSLLESTMDAGWESITVLKSSKDTKMGMTIGKAEGNTESSIKVTDISPDSLFHGTALKPNQFIQSINGKAYASFEEGMGLLKTIEGPLTIVVADTSPPPFAVAEKFVEELLEQNVMDGGIAADGNLVAEQPVQAQPTAQFVNPQPMAQYQYQVLASAQQQQLQARSAQFYSVAQNNAVAVTIGASNQYQSTTISEPRKQTQAERYGYGDKYSSKNVNARKNADGTVVPASAPKLMADGTFSRPSGRQRKGCEWDSSQGVWVPAPVH